MRHDKDTAVSSEKDVCVCVCVCVLSRSPKSVCKTTESSRLSRTVYCSHRKSSYEKTSSQKLEKTYEERQSRSSNSQRTVSNHVACWSKYLICQNQSNAVAKSRSLLGYSTEQRIQSRRTVAMGKAEYPELRLQLVLTQLGNQLRTRGRVSVIAASYSTATAHVTLCRIACVTRYLRCGPQELLTLSYMGKNESIFENTPLFTPPWCTTHPISSALPVVYGFHYPSHLQGS